MVADAQIAEVVKAGVLDVLPSAKISRVDVRTDIDSTEQPSLAIMVVFARQKIVSLSGKEIFSLHEAIQQRLLDAGETRYPFLRFVGEKELRGAVS